MGCRNRRRGEDARKQIILASHNKNVCLFNWQFCQCVLQIHLFELDLASLASIDRFVQDVKVFLKSHPSMHLYGVVANAGVMICPWGLTKDGFEMQMGTNHVSDT